MEIAPNNSDATLEIGSGDNPITINSEGVSVGGSNLIKKSGGTVSIGENSLKLREQGGGPEKCPTHRSWLVQQWAAEEPLSPFQAAHRASREIGVRLDEALDWELRDQG